MKSTSFQLWLNHQEYRRNWWNVKGCFGWLVNIHLPILNKCLRWAKQTVLWFKNPILPIRQRLFKNMKFINIKLSEEDMNSWWDEDGWICLNSSLWLLLLNIQQMNYSINKKIPLVSIYNLHLNNIGKSSCYRYVVKN